MLYQIIVSMFVIIELPDSKYPCQVPDAEQWQSVFLWRPRGQGPWPSIDCNPPFMGRTITGTNGTHRGLVCNIWWSFMNLEHLMKFHESGTFGEVSWIRNIWWSFMNLQHLMKFLESATYRGLVCNIWWSFMNLLCFIRFHESGTFQHLMNMNMECLMEFHESRTFNEFSWI